MTRVLLLAVLFCGAQSLNLSPEFTTRRAAIRSIFGTASSAAVFLPFNLPALADDDYKYELRDRNKNKDALIREDYWYFR